MVVNRDPEVLVVLAELGLELVRGANAGIAEVGSGPALGRGRGAAAPGPQNRGAPPRCTHT